VVQRKANRAVKKPAAKRQKSKGWIYEPRTKPSDKKLSARDQRRIDEGYDCQDVEGYDSQDVVVSALCFWIL
jgi:hypothetical protein